MLLFITVVIFLLLCSSTVYGAVDLVGSQAPRDGSNRIGSPYTNISRLHNCPMLCEDYANIHSWLPYTSVRQLSFCNDAMLLKFSVIQLLDDPETTILIRSCSTRKFGSANPLLAGSVQMDNPKKSKYLTKPRLDTALACTATGTQVSDKLALLTASGGRGDVARVTHLLEDMQKYFDNQDNCDESFLFAYHEQTVVGIYIGARYNKSTAVSALGSLARHLRNKDSISNHTVAQLCGSGRSLERVIGISIDITGNLAAVQRASMDWSNGNCITSPDLGPSEDLLDVKILEIVGLDGMPVRNRALPRGKSAVKIPRKVSKRATCSYIQVAAGDGCWGLAQRCGISEADLRSFNDKPNLCGALHPGDYVCCSPGDPHEEPKPDPPQPNPDGTCATHLIVENDTCSLLAARYGVTVAEIEGWNNGKTWAWTSCDLITFGYTICVSDGLTPLPPPQAGTQCGPIMPGTQRPADPGVSMADINPCPLNACCSNWGFCGVFPGHCEVHAPPGGGPGSKEASYSSTCISNCETSIQQNSGPPAIFSRIGYYEAFNLNRDCLWMKAKNANADSSYTHLHWGFAEIDPVTWKPVIVDGEDQWKDFKRLPNVKRIVSFGGWAYSTEPATYNIIRQAIIDNRETFAANIALFVVEEGLDGVDIDWEYPGATDIYVDGQPIGKPTDGEDYLEFLTLLKHKLGLGISVSIAAPASFWYLKAFPINRIAAVIDYIVYMTYDLHGQWDYGNANSFDSCDSGKCIRSHVNLTETVNALAMVTKAGVPNNKIFVGEASYGRTFHMAENDCWGPLCEFTGTRLASDATPGRCTKTPGYLAYAEITEILKSGSGVLSTFHDGASNSDILLYNGDFVSYMTPLTKETRRDAWRGLNFAGSIDWAIDLQAFSSDDMDKTPERPSNGEQGCLVGMDRTLNSADLCEFSCSYGFCPDSICICIEEGVLEPLPAPVSNNNNMMAWDEFNVDLNRLCKFACKYGYCPEDICRQPAVEEEFTEDLDHFDYESSRRENQKKCQVFRDPQYRDASVNQCQAECQEILNLAKEEGRTSNWGCVGFYEGQTEIPWYRLPGSIFWVADGQCVCDNFLINEIADTIVEALPIIAQIGCYILLSSLRFVLDIGAQFIPGVGKGLDAGLDMAISAAQLIAYIYPEAEDPEGAFSWWLSPCGGTTLVPEDIKRLFDILSIVPSGVSSFKQPKNIRKGSGRKGDIGNPTDRSKPRAGAGSGVQRTKTNCKVPPSSSTKRSGHTLRMQSCVGTKTKKDEMVITSIHYAATALPTPVARECSKRWSQACYHYSSAVSVNPQWATLTCPPEAAATSRDRMQGNVVDEWKIQHSGGGWLDPAHRSHKLCQRDEYPPAYLLSPNNPAMLNSGLSNIGQSLRYLPGNQNGGAGSMWKGACFLPLLKALSDREFRDMVENAAVKVYVTGTDVIQTLAAVTIDQLPYFTITSWGQAGNVPANDGLDRNPCWPSNIAPADPGFAIMTYDPYYRGQDPPYDYEASYVPGQNGV